MGDTRRHIMSQFNGPQLVSGAPANVLSVGLSEEKIHNIDLNVHEVFYVVCSHPFQPNL